jgi:hypothetical protein
MKVFKNAKKLPRVIITDTFTTKNKKQVQLRDAYGLITRDENNEPLIVINKNVPKNEILPTVIHEMWGHFGASKIVEELDIEKISSNVVVTKQKYKIQILFFFFRLKL